MGAMSARRAWVNDSLEVEALAWRRALQFAVDIGFSDLIIEEDSVQVMNAIKSRKADLSQLGHIFEDIQVLISRLNWAKVEWVNRKANSVAHNLACYAKNISDDVIWLEDSPPPTLESLFHGSLSIL